MRKQNGTTIVEVLISIIIITIVLGLLFNMFLQIRNEDNSNQIQANFTINQSTIVKDVEEDIVNYGVKRVSSCDLSEANISSIATGFENKHRCIKIEYAADYIEDKIGFLMLYNTYSRYDTDNGAYVGQSDTASWMIQYVRGHYTKTYANGSADYSSFKNGTQTMKQYPTEVSTIPKVAVKYSATGTVNAASINFPIETGDGERYDINLSFTFNGNSTFKCLNNHESSFECICLSGDALCQPTYS
ncbi:MAG: prepilin-type N-terminal cleavage/methylation domain-containing protein [Erysipelotrichales bacterium]|nr:prepilin-type N-terminal cleavage/methylation domain-containing protein [Erysipelotrichales bacterium]